MQKDLKALLAIWKRTRQPRVADLIDRVSSRFELDPVRASSVPERVQRVEKLAARAKTDPTLVPSVLATEWPGTWQGALPMLRAVLRLPEDPRVARALAEQVDATRYDTWTSKNFYRPLFTRLNKLGDRRQLELLEKQLTRSKPTYYAQDMRVMEEKAVQLHRALPPAKKLSAAEEQFLTGLEAQFAGAASTEKSRKQSGAALLDAVLADPGNLAARQVYGDWLVEVGDPRGELIALQLAADPKTEGKRKTLIKKHWKKWLGPLGDWFPKPPEFELGFPCAGSSSNWTGSNADFRTVLDSPLWRTFRRLEVFTFGRMSAAELATHANLPILTELGPVSVAQLRGLVKIGHAKLEALSVLPAHATEEPLEAKSLRSLPKLQRLSITSATLPAVGPAIHELQTLRFPWESPSGANFTEMLERCARIDGVRTVEFTFDTACTLRFTRGKHGFSQLEIPRVGRPLVFVLQTLPTTIESMTFSEPFALTNTEDQTSVARSMERFPHLKSPFVVKEKPTFGPHIGISLRGVALGDPKKIPRVWKILTEGFCAKFDGFSVGYGTGFFELGDDPVARMVGRTSKNARVELRLKQREGPANFTLLRERDLYTTGDLPLLDRAKFCDAFDELIAFAKPSELSVSTSKKSVRLDTKAAIARHPNAVRTLIMEAK